MTLFETSLVLNEKVDETTVIAYIEQVVITMGISNFMFPGLPQCPRCGPGTRRRWVREQGAATTGPGTPTAGPQDAAAG